MSYYTQSPKLFKQFLETTKIVSLPEKITNKWLTTIGFHSKNNRTFINILKQISFIDDSNKPTENFFKFQQFEKSEITMANCIIKGYNILYEIYPEAHKENSKSIINLFIIKLNISLSTAKLAEKTFRILTEFADFDAINENNLNRTSSKFPRIFLSYSLDDRDVAQNITSFLENNGYNVKYSYENDRVDEQFFYEIRKVISSNDYLFILLSESYLNNDFVRSDVFGYYLNELRDRNIMLVSFLISDALIPNYLKEHRILNIKNYGKLDILNLITEINNAQKIDFSLLTGDEFEKLITDLLKELNFVNITRQYRVNEMEIDIMAEYINIDPFGFEEKDIYIIETKLYKTDRASLAAISQFISNILTFPTNYKAILITTSQLTSSAKKWLNDIILEKRINIKLIEGPELKNILIKYSNLIDRYFSNKKEDI